MPTDDEDRKTESRLASDPASQEQKVGYGHPPLATRFQRGQSGNPKGRPKGAKNFKTLLQAALKEKITVNENGKRRKITKMQAGVKQFANKVASGDVKTTLRLLDLHCRDEELARAINRVENDSLTGCGKIDL